MIMRTGIASLALSVVMSVGCASHAATPGELAPAGERSSRYLLLPPEIERAKSDNVYDVIVKLRPEFLRGHGDPTTFVNQDIHAGKGDPGSSGQSASSAGVAVVASTLPVVAYHDNAKLSSVDDLKLLPLTNVAEIRYVPGPQAGVKYGTNHAGGVIIVISK
jgi:hypothetical protein